MKKYFTTALIVVITGIFLVGCGGQAIKKSAPTFTPYQFNADQYVPEIDNFVVIMDNSYSMNDNYGSMKKGDIIQKFLAAMNQTLPELGYNAKLVTFGADNTKVQYGPTRYVTADFCKALSATAKPSGNSSKPLTEAISSLAKDLESTQGKIAILIVSDGERLTKDPVNAAQELKKQFGNRLCIDTVLIGDNPGGAKALQQIADAGTCGSAASANDLGTAGALGTFVEGIFLAKKPAPKLAPPVALPKDSDGDGVTDDIDQCPRTPKGATVDARGCWTYEATVLFDFDSTKIKADATPMLDEAIDILKRDKDLKVEIDGHTDNIGPEAYNMKLSERRAQAIMKYFIDHGVNAAQLTARGFGMSQPAVNNNTKEGRAKNRRVELKPIR